MLTAEEKRTLDELETLIGEYDRRHKEEKLKYYNTGAKVHKKQLEFHACPKRNRWVLGGNRTGKTECGAVEAAFYARGNHPYRTLTRATEGWVVSLTNEVQRDVAQQKLLSYLNPAWIKEVKMRIGRADDYEHGVIDYILVESIHGGLSRITFKSCEQGRAKFQGTSLDYVWFDEEPPEEIYQECQMRIIDRQGNLWGTMTPLMGLTWVYDVIYMNVNDDPEIWCSAMQWSDNPFLAKEEIERLATSSTFTRPRRSARRASTDDLLR